MRKRAASPRIVINLAQAAESAGWEAIFLWDHLAFVWNSPSIDPWIALTTYSTHTSGALSREFESAGVT